MIRNPDKILCKPKALRTQDAGKVYYILHNILSYSYTPTKYIFGDIVQLQSYRRLAFSLVELSIVLVILGLLVGGVLSGQALIRAAEQRSIGTDVNKYKIAVATFRDKYFQYPGDMTNATSFWGFADGGDGYGSDCRAAETNDKRTCNGDGDGLISVHPSYEYARLWQHLSNASLIEGSYIGTSQYYVSSCNVQRGGCVYPGSRSGNGSLWLIQIVNGAGSTYNFYNGKNALLLTNNTTGSSYLGYNLKPEEAYNIDTKMDDGRPGTGNVSASRIGLCDTSAVNDGSDAARMVAKYRLNSTAVACVLYFSDIAP